MGCGQDILYFDKYVIKFKKKGRSSNFVRLSKRVKINFPPWVINKKLEFSMPSLISEKDILKKIELRNHARENKDYKKADRIRDELLDKGILIEDKDGKTIWKFK